MSAAQTIPIVLLGRDNRKTRTNNPHATRFEREEEDDGFVDFWWTTMCVDRNRKSYLAADEHVCNVRKYASKAGAR